VDLGLAGRRALVIGAGGTIGRAVVPALRAEGVDVTVVSHRPASDPTTAWLTADLADPAQRQMLIDTVRTRSLDIVVSLAATPGTGRVSTLSAEELDRAMAIKVWGPAAIVEAVAPGMAERGSGRIVLTSGLAGREPLTDYVRGGVTNAAIRNLVKSLAPRWAARGVTVNAISPGPVHSPRLDEWRASGSGERHPWMSGAAAMPAGRDVEADEVAAVIVFLVSAKASGINGTEIQVDGAATLGI
jgi:NAD(P)-dependent dehydrogenase (short-subunit alcohol dehydrogenase family)